MCVIDLEPCSTWHESHPRARKEHKCNGCDGPIAVGEKYLRHFSVYDGSVTHGKLCAPCESARDEFASEHDSLVPVPDFLQEMIADCIGEGDESAERWGPLLAAMQARGAPEHPVGNLTSAAAFAAAADEEANGRRRRT